MMIDIGTAGKDVSLDGPWSHPYVVNIERATEENYNYRVAL